jgi:5-dehydro-4-deoxyglucarate dehydratase
MLSGVLFFPVTPFDATGSLDLAALGTHLERGLENSPGGVFAACGTGEFHAIDHDEHRAVVETTVRVVAGRVPVFAGAGGPLPHAVAVAQAAEAAGADGLLLMPPYLVAGPAAGLVEYTRRVAEATTLDIIVYHRGTARFTETTAVEVAAIENVVGLKDGVGDLDLMGRIVLAVTESAGPGFQFFNGLPTAEATQRAYRAIGVPLYSSATFAFAPDIATAFYTALETGDDEALDRISRAFYGPLVRLRDRVPGYAVSLVKAGVELGGIAVGAPRPPLVAASLEHIAELEAIIEAGRASV